MYIFFTFLAINQIKFVVFFASYHSYYTICFFFYQSPEKLKENIQSPVTAGVSAESDEYDTASEESGSGEYSDESGSDEELEENEDGSVILDVERQSGDGQEQDETKKKVDDDEDRSNPQYIPKKGTFYEHDDRTAEDA